MSIDDMSDDEFLDRLNTLPGVALSPDHARRLRNIAGTIRAEGKFKGIPAKKDVFDVVQRPGHYVAGGIEHIVTFEEGRCHHGQPERGLPAHAERFLGGMEYAADTMLFRAGRKPYADLNHDPVRSALRDWEKALWYIDRGAKFLKALVERATPKKEG